MQLVKIVAPKGFRERGLDVIRIHRIGRKAVIAGKNGAGKTRLLNLIMGEISEYANSRKH